MPFKKRQSFEENSYCRPTRIESRGTQTNKADHTLIARPEIRKSRNYCINIKDAIATVSYKAAISIGKVRLAVQATCDKFYGHRYYLSTEEQQKYEPQLSTITEAENEDIVSDDADEPVSKRPRTASEYQTNYRYVLPSRNISGDFKHDKAMKQEITAAEVISSKTDGTKVTLHYDTTSRSKIDGEWPSLILNFLSQDKANTNMFMLRALFFADEDREQIT